MTSGQYNFDETWNRLCQEVTNAQLEVSIAEEEVRVKGYGHGRREVLEAAERELEDKQEQLTDREATISDSRWGMW